MAALRSYHIDGVLLASVEAVHDHEGSHIGEIVRGAWGHASWDDGVVLAIGSLSASGVLIARYVGPPRRDRGADLSSGCNRYHARMDRHIFDRSWTVLSLRADLAESRSDGVLTFGTCSTHAGVGRAHNPLGAAEASLVPGQLFPETRGHGT